jgi:hypothetical protein
MSTEAQVDFLQARLNEDEALIRRNLGNCGVGDDGWFPDYRTYGSSDAAAADDYLHHFRPPRLLAGVEADRRVIALYEFCRDHQNSQFDVARLEVLEDVVALCILPYAAHPDYDPTWRGAKP